MSWTESELTAIQTLERAGSVISLVGCMVIVVSYTLSSAFRKPITRLLFYASFGNILASVAILISRDGISAGADSALCQIQAFFIQQWMPADSLWSFCMALNIYLAFYKRYSAAQLKSLEWMYILACYGLPLIPSLTLLFVKTEKRGRIYGPAEIWCSIADSWAFMRLVIFYGPVWLIIAATLSIYLIVGRDILRRRRDLQKVTKQSHELRAALDRPSNSTLSAVEFVGCAERMDQLALCPSDVESLEQRQDSRKASKEMASNAGVWAYSRTSFLFFVALVVTWLPSSANRLYLVIRPGAPLFGLNLVGAFVLSLQGFWNAIIYLSTSFTVLKRLWSSKVTVRFS